MGTIFCIFLIVTLIIYFALIGFILPRKVKEKKSSSKQNTVATNTSNTWFSLPEFNNSERRRFQIYIDNLIRNPPPNTIRSKITGSDRKEHFVMMDPKNEYSLENNGVWKIFNTGLKDELDEIFNMYPGLPRNKLLKTLVLETDNTTWFEEPTVVKTRTIGGNTQETPYAIIGKLRYKHHFENISKVMEIERGKTNRDKKINKIVWRGNIWNLSHRKRLVEKWSNNNLDHMDIAPCSSECTGLEKPRIEIEGMLNYKYILSVQGTDISTGLKWNMASKSVVFMPRPTVESWFCESELVEWVHYIPIKEDYSDLLEKKLWCDNHPDLCEEIVQNANEYVSKFANKERENYIFYVILKTYFSMVHFVF